MRVAHGIEFPTDAVTQTFAFLGRKGSGKTYAVGRLVEGLLDTGTQVVVLDPVGNWYGLRLSSTGTSPSRFAIPILGGEHGDVSLTPESGDVVADFVVSTGKSVILDVSHFRKEQRNEFAAAFAEQLFHRKKTQRTPMHLVIEEAQVFAPQRAGNGKARVLEAVEEIVRLGRNYGIGCSMISQRPQSINKEVLNQAEPLVMFQLVAKHERDAVRAWMEHAGAERRGLLDELPSLDTGDCFLWSPAWLRRFERTRFLTKETFDASATPVFGEDRPEPKRLKSAELDSLNATIVEQSKSNDPEEIRKKVRGVANPIGDPTRFHTRQQPLVKKPRWFVRFLLWGGFLCPPLWIPGLMIWLLVSGVSAAPCPSCGKKIKTREILGTIECRGCGACLWILNGGLWLLPGTGREKDRNNRNA